MHKFIGRIHELESLRWLLKKRAASFVVVRGRRRIGKSRLIQEFGKDLKIHIFTGLPPTPATTRESQINEFARQISSEFKLPEMKFRDWGDLFSFLAEKVRSERTILVFDEISWVGSQDPDFLGKLKTAWDLQFKKNDKLVLIVCGSVSAWIERNILRSTGFVGRISSTITLDELSLPECDAFWGEWRDRVTPYEKFKMLGVTGGIPRYLEEIRPELTAEQNIKHICFSREGFLFSEFDQIFSDVFLSRSEIYKDIILKLRDQSWEPNKLCEALGIQLNSALSGYFEELLQAGFISRDFTWHLSTQASSKLSQYRLKDNYLRFYLKYILPNKRKIETGAFRGKSLSTLPGWNTLMGLQFENLVLNNRHAVWKLLEISPEDIVWDNPFFQRPTQLQPGCQIDYLIQTKFNNLYVCEIKFSTQQIQSTVITDINQKIERLKVPKNFSYRPVLIHVNGVSEEIEESHYFSGIIDFGSLISTT